MKHLLVAACAALALTGAAQARPVGEASLEVLAREFQSPPKAYRPIAAYQVDVMPADIAAQVDKALGEHGYGAFLFAPSGDPHYSVPPQPFGVASHLLAGG